MSDLACSSRNRYILCLCSNQLFGRTRRKRFSSSSEWWPVFVVYRNDAYRTLTFHFKSKHMLHRYIIFLLFVLFLISFKALNAKMLNNHLICSYLGGVSFMEADDEISIRDLEVGRHSVIRPAHTFFGLIQLSGLQQ